MSLHKNISMKLLRQFLQIKLFIFSKLSKRFKSMRSVSERPNTVLLDIAFVTYLSKKDQKFYLGISVYIRLRSLGLFTLFVL